MIENIIYSNTLDGQVNKDGWSLENFDKGSVSQSRMWVYLPRHPRSSRTGQQLRAWAAYELYHGVRLKSGSVIHHKNGNPLDDSRENLELTTRGGHNTTHFNTTVEIVCEICGKKFTVKRCRLKNGRSCCSMECGYKKRKKKTTYVDHVCLHCGKSFTVPISRSNRGNVTFCSWECRACALKEGTFFTNKPQEGR